MTRVTVVYYSSTGTVHSLAESLAAGAAEEGAEVRLRRVAETAPPEAIDARPEWRAHLDATADVPVVSHDDLRWADAVAFGTPTRFGNVSAQLKQFLDSTGPLWFAGELADKVGTAFTSAGTMHGGNETTALALYNTLHHWGMVIAAPGYTDPSAPAGGQTPYGTAHPSSTGRPGPDALAAARHQGRRLARIGGLVAAGGRAA